MPALAAAARSEADEYVRYRALTLLSGFNGPVPGEVMKELRGDRNDRLRLVAYAWFEHHPDPALVPLLIEAMQKEQSEFVRPALTRALAAHAKDPRRGTCWPPLVLRGADFFVAQHRGVGDTAAPSRRRRHCRAQQRSAVTDAGRAWRFGILPVSRCSHGFSDPRATDAPTISAALPCSRACEETENTCGMYLISPRTTKTGGAARKPCTVRGGVERGAQLAVRQGSGSPGESVRAPVALALVLSPRKPLLATERLSVTDPPAP